MTAPDPGFFIPKQTEFGASPVGNSYLALFANCPKAWYNNYLRPIPTTGREGEPLVTQGISPMSTALPLVEGDIFHTGLEAWYLSGCRDGADTGEYDTDQGLTAAESKWSSRKRHYETDVDEGESWANMQTLLLNYFERYGPNGDSPDFPTVMVAHDGEGKPLVEREFKSDLPYGNYYYTMRADLVVLHRGYLKMGEHKTSVASFLGQRLKSTHYDSQMTGQCWVMRENFPDTPLNGVWVNVIVKFRSAKSKFDIAERETTTRSQFQLDNFPLGAADILQQIDDRVGDFHRNLGDGVDKEMAAQLSFPDHGTRSGRCFAFNRYCDYFNLCQNPGREETILSNYRPRTTLELDEMKRYTG
jgi:hypothetical protein